MECFFIPILLSAQKKTAVKAYWTIFHNHFLEYFIGSVNIVREACRYRYYHYISSRPRQKIFTLAFRIYCRFMCCIMYFKFLASSDWHLPETIFYCWPIFSYLFLKPKLYYLVYLVHTRILLRESIRYLIIIDLVLIWCKVFDVHFDCCSKYW